MVIRIFPTFGDIPPTTFWLTFPEAVRKPLESTLVYLIDTEAAAISFFDIVPKAIDVDGSIASFVDAISTGGSEPDMHLAEKMRTNQKFYNYGPGKAYSPLEQLDLLCVCSPKHELRWRAFIDSKGIRARNQEIKPCFSPGCSYSEPAFYIPLWQNTIYAPDEYLWDKEEIIPELKIIFPKGKAFFRRFLHVGDFWIVANTCADHGSREVLQEYIESLFFGRYVLKACFSDKLFDDSVLEKPSGINIHEENYKKAEL